MFTNTQRAVFSAALLALTANFAHAVPVSGEILIDEDDGLYSFYQAPAHDAEPLFFSDEEDGFTLDFNFDYDFASGTVGLDGTQAFQAVSVGGGDSIFILILDLFIDTNDTDGFLGGSMLVSFDSETPLTINFSNSNTDGTPFNTTSIDNGVFSAFLSGAAIDGPQLNFAFSGAIGPIGVAEPSLLALLALGGLAFGYSRRR